MDLIIVNYKSTDFLHACLDSIYNSLNGLSVNIYVSNNCPNDKLYSIKHDFPEINLIENESNVGFSKAINKILKNTSAPYIVLLNPDTIVDSSFFETMTSFMESNKGVGIAGPKIFDLDGGIQGSARSFPTICSSFSGRTSLLSKFFPNNRFTLKSVLSNNSDGKTPMEVDWVSGACMVVRRKALENVGLLDEGFFLYWEDADWCRRMGNGGWKVIYYPKASIKHMVGGSSERNILRSTYEFHKSAYRLYKKYHNPSRSFLKLAVFLGLTCRFLFILNIQLARRFLIKMKQKYSTNKPLTPGKTHFMKTDE